MMNYTKFFTTTALFLVLFHTQAQTKSSSDLSLSIGQGTSQEFLSTFEDIIDKFVGGTITYGDRQTIPGITIRYSKAIKDRWLLGGVFGYQTQSKDVFVSGTKSGKIETNLYTVALESDYRYISKPSFRLYSGLGLGYTFGKNNYDGNNSSISLNRKSQNYFNFQATALGFRFGEQLGIFAELGFGYKGVLNAGLSYQF